MFDNACRSSFLWGFFLVVYIISCFCLMCHPQKIKDYYYYYYMYQFIILFLFQKMHTMLKRAWDAEGSPFKGQPFDPSKCSVDPSGIMHFKR